MAMKANTPGNKAKGRSVNAPALGVGDGKSREVPVSLQGLKLALLYLTIFPLTPTLAPDIVALATAIVNRIPEAFCPCGIREPDTATCPLCRTHVGLRWL